jgi:hypothetical protein
MAQTYMHASNSAQLAYALPLLADTAPTCTCICLSQVQELLQQVSGLSNRTVMIDTCKALLAQQPADVIGQHLQAALSLTDADDPGSDTPVQASSSSTAQTASSPPTGAAAAAASRSSGSTSQAGELPLPLQLVIHLKQELQQLGFSVGGAPPLTVASSSLAAEDAGQASSGSAAAAAAAADTDGVGSN